MDGTLEIINEHVTLVNNFNCLFEEQISFRYFVPSTVTTYMQVYMQYTDANHSICYKAGIKNIFGGESARCIFRL